MGPGKVKVGGAGILRKTASFCTEIKEGNEAVSIEGTGWKSLSSPKGARRLVILELIDLGHGEEQGGQRGTVVPCPAMSLPGAQGRLHSRRHGPQRKDQRVEPSTASSRP